MNIRSKPLGIARENRKCNLCKDNIEKEYRVLLACPHFTDLSKKSIYFIVDYAHLLNSMHLRQQHLK